MIVSKETLQCRQRNPLLHGRHTERVSQDVGRNLPADLSAVRDQAHHSLNRSNARAEFIMQREVSFEKRLHAGDSVE